MSEEHPLAVKLREKKEADERAAKAAAASQRQAENLETLSRTEWPNELAKINSAIASGNAVLEAYALQERYQYEALTAAADSVAHGAIRVGPSDNPSQARMLVTALTFGKIKVLIEQKKAADGKRQTEYFYKYGELNSRDWESLLKRLHDALGT